ncbi:MAG: HPr(Ser) kinase/phosphatase [Mycoplasmatales bacterium]
MKSVKVRDVLEAFDCLKVLNTDDCNLDNKIEIPELSRPGVELVGYTEFFPYRRIQIFGKQETSYLEKIKYDPKILDVFLHPKTPMIIFCRDIEPTKDFIDRASKLKIPICVTNRGTSKFNSIIYSFLEESLAPETQVHGVLLSVFGMGVMIKGASGVGKSEIALELINRGHLLVADDAVVIKRVDDATLIGSAPALLKNRLEIRGVGIINVQKLYGITKVLPKKAINLIIEIRPMDGQEDRIGNAESSLNILGHDVPLIRIPISSGRSVSNLVEVAVANYDLKKEYKYDSSKAFIEDLDSMLRGETKWIQLW